MNGAYIHDLREHSEALAEETRVRWETQAMLLQIQKMESVGLLAGGIAHDFNNLMTVVIGNLDSVERRFGRVQSGDAAAISRPVAAALQGARRAASLTQRLLAFSRQQVHTASRLESTGREPFRHADSHGRRDDLDRDHPGRRTLANVRGCKPA
jgi:signal transduction histidine kinase